MRVLNTLNGQTDTRLAYGVAGLEEVPGACIKWPCWIMKQGVRGVFTTVDDGWWGFTTGTKALDGYNV